MNREDDGCVQLDCVRCGAPIRVPYRDYRGDDTHVCEDCDHHDSAPPPKDGYESTTFTLDEEKPHDGSE